MIENENILDDPTLKVFPLVVYQSSEAVRTNPHTWGTLAKSAHFKKEYANRMFTFLMALFRTASKATGTLYYTKYAINSENGPPIEDTRQWLGCEIKEVLEYTSTPSRLFMPVHKDVLLFSGEAMCFGEIQVMIDKWKRQQQQKKPT